MKDRWEAIDAGLVSKTGRSVDEWLAIARATGIERHKPLVDHLKAREGLTHGYANSVALRVFGSDPSATDDAAVTEAMFAGAKAALLPIHERLVGLMQAFGGDIELVAKKGYFSARRSKQFAILQPSTKDRYDLGLKLRDVEPSGRLEAAASFNAMVSHRVRLHAVAEVDADVSVWLRRAYDQA